MIFLLPKKATTTHPTNSYIARAPYIMVMKNRTQAPTTTATTKKHAKQYRKELLLGGFAVFSGQYRRGEDRRRGGGTYNHIHI